MTNFINNEWQEGSGNSFHSISPVDNSVLWQGKASTNLDVDNAVKAAQAALPLWSRLSFNDRVAHLAKFAQIVEDIKEDFAIALAKEVGKPLWEARTEVASVANKFKISLDAYAERTRDRQLSFGNSTDVQSITRHRPHGVLAVFGPYNFPLHTPNGHIMPALIAGNTVVFKPSELTPYVAEMTMQCWEQAGLPPGVINLVQGEVDTGIHLSSNKEIDGILFTGSSRTGKLIHKQFGGETSKILALEMGGNNPLIVHQIEDIQAAAYTIIQSAFLTSGQRCTCARRLILIENDESKKLIEQLLSMTAKIQIGNPLTEEVFMGPVISEKQAANIFSAFRDLNSRGGEILLEQKILEGKQSKAYINPGIINSTRIKDLPDEEIFGPTLQIFMVKNWDEAINKANATKYGLSSGLISDDPKLFEDFFFRIKAGLVNWNNQITGASSAAPFGGIGDSGNHRPSAYYAADYCAYPVASLESKSLKMPEKLSPGLVL